VRAVVLAALLVSVVALGAGLEACRGIDAEGQPTPSGSAPDPAVDEQQARFDHERRPEEIVKAAGIKPGMRVADIGAGDGYYTVRLARRLGPGATVYAEDVQPPYLDRLRARLAREHIEGVTVIHGTPRDPRLPPASVDVAILAHVYHEIEHPYEFLYRLRPALAPGARLAIVEIDRPTQDHGTPPALLRCELAAVGYRQIDVLPLTPADGYLAVFVPPDSLPRVETIRPCTQ